MATPKYYVGDKVYIRSSPYGLWSGQLCKVISSREGMSTTREGMAIILYDIEFQYMGKPTLLKDYAEHNLLPFYGDTYQPLT